jgi:hypothetical protein
MPRNAATGRHYSGINVLILWGAVVEHGLATLSSLDVQQIADERHAISAFGASLPPSASEATPEVVQPAGISSQSRVRFRSARFGIGACLLPGACCFIFAS